MIRRRQLAGGTLSCAAAAVISIERADAPATRNAS